MNAQERKAALQNIFTLNGYYNSISGILGIDQEFFIYREGELVWGKGDPTPSIQISANAFVHTLQNAKELIRQLKLNRFAHDLHAYFVTGSRVSSAGSTKVVAMKKGG